MKKIKTLLLALFCMIMFMGTSITALAENDWVEYDWSTVPYSDDCYEVGVDGRAVVNNAAKNNGTPKTPLLVYHLTYGEAWENIGFTDWKFDSIWGEYGEDKVSNQDYAFCGLVDHYYIRDDAKNARLDYPEELGWLPENWHVYTRQIALEEGEYCFWRGGDGSATLAPDLEWHQAVDTWRYPEKKTEYFEQLRNYDVHVSGSDPVIVYTIDGVEWYGTDNEDYQLYYPILHDFAVKNEAYRAENALATAGEVVQEVITVEESETVEETIAPANDMPKPIYTNLEPVKEAVIEEPADTGLILGMPLLSWILIGCVVVVAGIVIGIVVKKK